MRTSSSMSTTARIIDYQDRQQKRLKELYQAQQRAKRHKINFDVDAVCDEIIKDLEGVI